MSQLAGVWVAGDSGKELHYFVTQAGVALNVNGAGNIVLSLVRRDSGSDVNAVVSGEIASASDGEFVWRGANAVGLNVPQPSSRHAPHVYEARVSFTIDDLVYWSDPFRIQVCRWGLSTVPTAAPGLDTGVSLQDMVDALEGRGGRIDLGSGTYYADPDNPTTPLTVPGNIALEGVGAESTFIKSPVLFTGGRSGLRELTVRPNGTDYGVKLYNGGTPFISRCFFDNVFIGGTGYHVGDGPVIGLHLDGAGVLLATRLTIAFCDSHGLLADSTGVEPNTTLNFDTCTFNLNGGFGVRILQSCTVARFVGGNMECNDSGEFYAESAALISLNAVDFERGPFGSPPVTPPTVNNVVEMQNVNTVEILGCNFLKLSSATRAFLLAGVGPLRHGGNRFEGWGANGVYRISENCSGVVKVSPNNIVGSLGWEEDYSR